MHGKSAFTILVDESSSGMRLDAVVSSCIDVCSRSHSAALIRNGEIKVRGEIKKPGYRVREGDRITGCIPPPPPVRFDPEPIPLDILHEDNHLIIVNKPPGLVVHPAPGHLSGTMVNAILHHCPELQKVEGELRPGIVHRLDKDTSGALIITKQADAREHLLRQFKSRTIKKKYLAIVHGETGSDDGSISLPIGRHPKDRKRMSTVSRKSRDAETGWRVRERFEKVTFLELDLKTGRTHQIRVHLKAIGHPVVGDAVYGGRKGAMLSKAGELSDRIGAVERQMLHAWRVRFDHPATGERITVEAPLPPDMNELILSLRSLQAHPMK